MSKGYILLLVVLVSFLFSCNDNKENQVFDVSGFRQDSLKITQILTAELNNQELDSLATTVYNEFQDIPQSHFFYTLHYGRLLILRGNLHKADSLINYTLQSTKLDTISIEAARLYNLKAAVSAYQQNQRQAVEYYKKALEIFESTNDLRPAASIEFNLANMFLSQMDYESSYKYSYSASEKLKTIKDTVHLPWSLAIASVSSANLDNFQQASLFANQAIELSEKHNNLMGKMLSGYALGEIDMYHEDYAAAIEHLSEVVAMSEKFNQKGILLPTKAALLKAYLKKENYQNAIKQGEEAKELANQLGNVEVKYNLYKNLAFSYQAIGETTLAFEYLKNAEELLREKATKDNQKAIQDLLIQYESEKKSNQILKQENVLAERKILMLVFIFLSVILLVVLVFYRERNKQKYRFLQQEREREVFNALNMGEEQERKRLSYELHDGVASNLIAIKLQLENKLSSTDFSKTLNLVIDTHQEVRKVAHNLMPIDFESQNIVSAISNFCRQCSTTDFLVNFESNTDKVTLSKAKSLVLYRVVQEFIQNAVKHSQATQTDVFFMKKEGVITLNIEDNGIGFDLEKEEKLKGFSNIIERLQKIQGKVNIDSSPGRGTSIFISLKTG